MEILYEVNPISCATRLILALILGGVLGYSRERKGRPAGIRTYMIVCVSSALVMLTNQYILELYKSGDPSRMGAQIISGIGFLGAGSIIITGRNRVKGLTTAAGLWAAACLGIASGIGFYYGAVIGGAFIFLVMEGLNWFDRLITKNNKYMSVYMEFSKISEMSQFMQSIREKNIRIVDFEIKHAGDVSEKDIATVLTMQFPQKTVHTEVLQKLTTFEGVKYIEEV